MARKKKSQVNVEPVEKVSVPAKKSVPIADKNAVNVNPSVVPAIQNTCANEVYDEVVTKDPVINKEGVIDEVVINDIQLTAAEEAFCQYVGCFRYKPVDAILYLFPEYSYEKAEKVGRSWARKKKLKPTIEKYREATNKKAITKASEIVSFDKADAMNHLQSIMSRADYALSSQAADLGKETVDRIIEILDDAEFFANDKKGLLRRLIFDKLSCSFNNKAAEVIIKATDQANKLYGNYEYNFTIDDKRDSLSKKLDNMDDKMLLDLAYGSNAEDILGEQPIKH